MNQISQNRKLYKLNCKVCGGSRDISSFSTVSKLAFCLKCYRVWNKHKAMVWRLKNPDKYKAIYTKHRKKVQQTLVVVGFINK